MGGIIAVDHESVAPQRIVSDRGKPHAARTLYRCVELRADRVQALRNRPDVAHGLLGWIIASDAAAGISGGNDFAFPRQLSRALPINPTHEIQLMPGLYAGAWIAGAKPMLKPMDRD